MVFKQLKSGFSKLFTPSKILIIIVFLLLAYAFMSYSGSKSYAHSGFESVENAPTSAEFNNTAETAEIGAGASSLPPKSSGDSTGFPATVTNPTDLLPVDSNNAWSNLNPALKGENGVQTPDLLQAGSLIGLDTIGQSLRNANLQLRSDPPIPKTAVGPWNNSTIEPDFIRAPFDINP
jgi:hypothetical protein